MMKAENIMTNAGPSLVALEISLVIEPKKRFSTNTKAASVNAGNKPSVWEAAASPSPAAQDDETSWQRMAEQGEKEKEEKEDSPPRFILVMTFKATIRDDDAVSDLNSEADVEDEDCLPEATIQVLEALFGELNVDDGYDSDDEESDTTTRTTATLVSEQVASFIADAFKEKRDDEEDEGDDEGENEKYKNNLPDATFRVLKSLFASLDENLDLSTTSTNSTTSIETP